jgi:hypothetical protein
MSQLIEFLGLLERRRYLSVLMAALSPILLSIGVSSAQAARKEKPVLFQEAVPIPVNAANTTGGLFSFDISWVDQKTQTYYLADRSNLAIDVVDANGDTFLTQISANPAFAGFTGNGETSGPNGVLTANGCIIATDAGNRVVSFTAGGAQVADVHITSDPGRADELAFDPKDGLLLVITPAPSGTIGTGQPTPTGTLISVNTACVLSVGTSIPFPTATNGAEQPVWDPGTQRFFVSIPNVNGSSNTGALFQINPLTATIEAMYAVNSCGPTGLALSPTNHTLLAHCGALFDNMGNPWTGTSANTAAPVEQIFGTDGLLQAIIPGTGVGDEAWYNAGDDHFYAADSGSPLAPSVIVSGATPVEQGAAILGVIDGTSQRLDQLVPTFNVPAITGTGAHPAGSAHSVAANENNNQVFVPLAGNNVFPGCLTGCVAIYTRSDVDLTGATD